MEKLTPQVVAKQRREIHDLYKEHIKYIRKTRLAIAVLAGVIALFFAYSAFFQVLEIDSSGIFILVISSAWKNRCN